LKLSDEGAPSADILDRIARALMLTNIEREHACGCPPRVHDRKNEGVTLRLHRVLDALESPDLIGTTTWDVAA
jgi:hypothetical protein